VTLAELARVARTLAVTTRRLEKVALVAEFLRGLTEEELPWAVTFLAGRPLPTSDSRALKVSGATLRGHAEALAVPDRSSLTLLDVAQAFSAIADATGAGRCGRT